MKYLVSLALVFAAAPNPMAGAALYETENPLYVRKVELCREKPRGMGKAAPSDGNEFKRTDKEVYIYVELANCKPERRERDYYINLAMDLDIYYEDGVCIYSEKDVNVTDYKSLRNRTDAYLWTKVEILHLKAGEYKIEMTITDENADKEAFALTRFKIAE